MELQLPGVDDFEKTLNLRHKAASAAENGAITAQDTAFDDGQQSVVYEMVDRVAKGRSTVAHHLEHHNKRQGEISAELEGFPRQSFPKTVEGAVNMTLRGQEEEFKKTQRAEELTFRGLKAYRLRFGIDRPARYPEWRVMHWAIVALLFLVESILNAQFFAKASTFGLIGGWLQAAIVSAVNIGLGLLGGMVVLPWRNRLEVSGKSTKVPSCVAVMIGFFLLLFNLTTAHYRVLLEDLPKQAIKLTINHLLNNPFAIDNFDAGVLLVVGILCATVAWIEGYKSDDPLHEYGRLARRYEKVLDENAEKKTAIRAKAVNQLKEKKKELMTAARQSKTLFADYSAQIARSMADANDYREWRGRIEKATRTLLSRYRSYYLQVDKLDPRPVYFDEEYLFPEDTPFIEEEERLKQAEARLPGFKQIVDELESIRDAGIEQECEVIVAVEKAVDDFFVRIEGVATKESDEAISSSSARDAEAEEAASGGSS